MSLSNDSNTTQSMFMFDFLVGIAAILYITNIAPIFFIALMCFILVGMVVGIIVDCRKWHKL